MSEDFPISRVCRTCNVEKLLTDFNRGNAAYGRKSECRECQNFRAKKYKTDPVVKLREITNQKSRRASWSQSRRTNEYLARKEYHSNWKKTNPDTYRHFEQAKRHNRRVKLSNSEKLTPHKVKLLESFNWNQYKQDNFVCEYCGIKTESYNLDHIIPVAKNGGNSIYNLAITCFSCNSSKKAKLLQDWNATLLSKINDRNIKLFYFIENTQ